MANNLLHSPLHIPLYILFLLPLFFSQSSSDSPSTICKSTLHPSFCNSLLLSTNSSSSTIYDYARFSVRKSLSAARKFLSILHSYLRKSKNLTITAIRALEDCKFLAESNIDYLTTTFQTVNQTSYSTLNTAEADTVQTLLSAILTNSETCIDGLQATASAWSIRNGVLTPLANNTRLYSLSLALFTRGWVHKRIKRRPVNLKMSAVFEAAKRDLNQVLMRDVVIVSKDGSGNFTTINDAVAASPTDGDGTGGYYVIYIRSGVYEEYVSIGKNQKYLMMIGDGINRTIITGSRSFVDGWTTFNSSTFSVSGTGFVAVNITFRNTAGAMKHQAVAVRNGADLSTFYLCSFEAYQDTLYVHSLRQFYRECDIHGTVDFIFGNAAAVFQNCNIYPRRPMSNQFNAITAQGRTDPNQNTGISIHNCSIRPADDLARSDVTIQTFLGRPWKEYSRTIYMQSFMGNLINPGGWSVWSGNSGLNTLYYAEFDNFGPGSNTARRVTWPGFHIVNATEAANFTVASFLVGDGWIPEAGVPYKRDLL